jgi:hypothetical protein
MAGDDGGPGGFRGASFTGEDFTGATFRDCDLRQVKITDSWLADVRLSGLVGSLVVNDVDVTAYVDGELDRRHPERVQLRAVRTASDCRAMWDTIENLWSQTVARARRLPGAVLDQRVDGEWPFAETLRHLKQAKTARQAPPRALSGKSAWLQGAAGRAGRRAAALARQGGQRRERLRRPAHRLAGAANCIIPEHWRRRTGRVPQYATQASRNRRSRSSPTRSRAAWSSMPRPSAGARHSTDVLPA